MTETIEFDKFDNRKYGDYSGERELYLKTYRLKWKLLALTAYGGEKPRCKICGMQDARYLCIDHINGGGDEERKKTGKRGNHFYKYLHDMDYPKGYQVLCLACNMEKQ